MSRLFGVYIGVVIKDQQASSTLSKDGKLFIKISGIGHDTVYQARLSTPSVGSNHAVIFLPEEGDQVLVAFERGQADEPIIIGSLWSSANAPSYSDYKDNNSKIIQTRGGNEIRITDKAGSEKIEIKTKDHKATIALQADGKIFITADQDGGKIIITADNVEIHGQLDVIGKAGTVTIKNNEIKGS